MNHTPRALAVCALTLSTAALGASTAAANHPAENGTVTDCHWTHHPACKEVAVSVPPAQVPLDPGPSDDNAAEARQAGAAGGAGLAFAGMWLYRRRHVPNI